MLETIKFTKYFDHPISPLGTLTLLHTIEFGSHFNQPIYTLCGMPFATLLYTIKFGKHFNQPINSLVSIASSLHTLELGEHFKQLIDPQLHENIQIIKFTKKIDIPTPSH